VDERLTPPWQPWEAIPVAIAALAAGLVAAVAIAALLGGVGGAALLLSTIAFQLSLAGFSILWARLRHRSGVRALGLRSRRPVTDALVGAVVGLGTVALVTFVVFPLEVLVWNALTGGPPGPIDQLPFDFTAPVIVLGTISVVVISPVAEEIFFRGFLYGSLRGRSGFWASAALSAATFSLFHPPPQLMVLIFVVGFVLAWLYERRGSLAAPIAAHVAFNLIGYVLIVMQRA
jgi:membrane protease YdiL (CAAX protease family)